MRANQGGAHAGATEPLDRLAVAAFGGLAVSEQRSGPRLDAERQLSSGRLRSLAELRQRVARELGLAATGSGFY
jgi:hypothetical protein